MYSVLKKYGLYKKRDDYIDLCYIGYTKALKTYDSSRGTLVNYMFNCIENEILAEIRREQAIKRQRIEHSLDDTDYQLSNMIPDNIDLEMNMIKCEEHKELCNAINKLTKIEQIVVCNLYELNDRKYTQTELAEILGKSQTDISIIKTQALLKLKNMLGDIE